MASPLGSHHHPSCYTASDSMPSEPVLSTWHSRIRLLRIFHRGCDCDLWQSISMQQLLPGHKTLLSHIIMQNFKNENLASGWRSADGGLPATVQGPGVLTVLGWQSRAGLRTEGPRGRRKGAPEAATSRAPWHLGCGGQVRPQSPSPGQDSPHDKE